MDDTTTTPPRPAELLSLRSATTTYLDMLRDVAEWAEQAADVNRRIRPDYAARLEGLSDEIRTALLPREMGTPAAVGRIVAELLGEA